MMSARGKRRKVVPKVGHHLGDAIVYAFFAGFLLALALILYAFGVASTTGSEYKLVYYIGSSASLVGSIVTGLKSLHETKQVRRISNGGK